MKKLMRLFAVLGVSFSIVVAMVLSFLPAEASGVMNLITVANNYPVSTGTAFYFPVHEWRSNTQGIFANAEFFYDITMPTSNTTTLSLEVSPDMVSWYPHIALPNILTNVTTTTSGYALTTISGRFFRVKVDANTTNTLTITLKALLTE